MPSVAIIGTRGYPSYYGGFETAVRKLAPYLANDGWDVTVYGRPNASRLEDHTRDPRIRLVETFGFETKSLSTLSFGLTSAIHAARHKPDVALVMNCANGFWLPILKHAGVPTLINVDGIEWDRAKWGPVAKWVFRTGATWTARHGTSLVFDAKEIARRWEEDFRRRGHFIPYGGDTVEADLPIEPGLKHREYVLMVARFVPENTVPQFFDAALMIAKHTDVVIVGSSGYGGELDERASKLAELNPRIHWLGHVSDDARLLSLWQHAGVYFHGHSVGGTNPALVQAMAAGAPIVARDTAYNREVLANGWFVEADPHAIAETVASVLQDQGGMDRHAEHNIRRAAEHYSWSNVNTAYASTLLSLLQVQRAHQDAKD
ncbi:glycosyltransferase [Microbacterium sp. ET2]|uniref:glycosyltransferase n=1 Tax=Microbacterium albipurpureum TaxID=3050384 RepID=UPI00259D0B74|nr:glycosyltransferase [Microbacterium sp. ET2 (Ac-2212)]WJL94756.1 glycosyltransferase [Microbacterium sp. ET2 (Ac-2212)]